VALSFVLFTIGLCASINDLMFFILRHNVKVRKKVEDALFINEWYNQTMISLGCAVIAVDANGIITFINRGMRANGWKQEKLIGKLIEEVFEISNENGLKVMKQLLEAIQNNKDVF
jgi:PAS domain-containing protein